MSDPKSTVPIRKKSRLTFKEVALQMALYLIAVPYGVLFIYALFFSNAVIFQPHESGYSDGADALKLKDAQGNVISATYLPNEQATHTILYSHGNAEDMGDIAAECKRLHDLGFAVLSYDYPGYGTSAGKPSEQGVYDAIDAAYAYLTEERKVSPEKIVLMGRSLGGGPTVDLAARKVVGGVILQSTFVSAFRVLTVWPILPFDKFKSLSKLKEVHCPVMVIHGTRDEVIAFHHGQTLFAGANEPKRFVAVPDATHNNVSRVNGGIVFRDAILAFKADLK